MSFRFSNKNLGYLNLTSEKGKQVIGMLNVNGQFMNIFGIKKGSVFSIYNENEELLVDAQIQTSKKDNSVKYFTGEILSVPVIIMKNKYKKYPIHPDLVILQSTKPSENVDLANNEKEIDDLFE